MINRRLVALVQPEGLREAAVLGGVNLAAGHQRHEVVLHRRRVVLLGEGRRRLARAGQPDD
jgi:hypothetical protein